MRNKGHIIRRTGVSRQTRDILQSPALLLIAGKWNALLYHYDGQALSLAGAVAVYPHQYSDDEGFFMRLAFGTVYGRGSVKERPDHETNRRFLDEIAGMFREAEQRFPETDAVYATLPVYRMRDIVECITQKQRKELVYVRKGNMLPFHPRDSADRLAAAIANENNHAVSPMSAEAKRLLEGTDARRDAPTRGGVGT